MRLLKRPEYFTWEEIKAVIKYNLKEWFIYRCNHGQWDIWDVEEDDQGVWPEYTFNRTAFENDLAKEYKAIDETIAIFASKLKSNELIAGAQILAARKPWGNHYRRWYPEGHIYYDEGWSYNRIEKGYREKDLCELLRVWFDDPHMLMYVLFALEICNYIYLIDGFWCCEDEENLPLTDPWPLKYYKRFLSEENAYQTYAFFISPTADRYPYYTPEKLKDNRICAEINGKVWLSKAKIYYRFIEKPDNIFTSEEWAAIWEVETRIKELHLADRHFERAVKGLHSIEEIYLS